MPVEYSNKIEHRLDNNILFYENMGQERYNLVDIFAIKGGRPIVLDMGTWVKGSGVQLERKINRWDRRRDLMGAKFVNTLKYNDDYGYFIYNNSNGEIFLQNESRCCNGTVIGLGGTYQDIVFYMTERLNLTVETRNEIRCQYLLIDQKTDVCSNLFLSTSWEEDRAVLITSPPVSFTLLAGVFTENTVEGWVYLEVFGLPQWLVFFSSLVILTIMMKLSGVFVDGNMVPNIVEEFGRTYLFMLQQGSHENNKHLSKRIISLTLSMTALLMFVCYANDITAKMTSGSPPHPVKTFQDVLDYGYRVIVVGKKSAPLFYLQSAKKGTAKRSVYELYLEDDTEKINQWEGAMSVGNFSEANKIELPIWQNMTRETYLWALEHINSNRKILLYNNNIGGKYESLKMDDAIKTYSGILIRRDSEFLPIFRHYVLKGFETGIFKRMHTTMREQHAYALHNRVVWYSRTPKNFGLTEPASLGIHNVMFPFAYLGGNILVSFVIAFVEYLGKKLSNFITKKTVVRFI